MLCSTVHARHNVQSVGNICYVFDSTFYTSHLLNVHASALFALIHNHLKPCTHTHAQLSANTLSMTAPCVSFPPPVMRILEPASRENHLCPPPFNGYRAGSTPHDSLFGTQPWIDLRHVKTSECSPCLNSPPSSSSSLSIMSSLYFLSFFCLPLCLFLSLCFQCLFKIIAPRDAWST